MEDSITKIKESKLYKVYGIIPNQVYDFEFEDGTHIDGIVMNFDGNQFCIKSNKGIYVIERRRVNYMYPSEISRLEWEEKCLKCFEDIIKEQNK